MKKTYIGLVAITIFLLLLLSGCTKTSFEQFKTKCENTGGNFIQPSCGSPTDPNCPERESICDCGATSYTYKDIKYTTWNGC